MAGKRSDYISWDEYFMAVAQLAGMRSKDPSTQVGSCIVSDEHKILSMGYNGLPIGCSDDDFPWERDGKPLMTKYPYVTHSELNAILNYRGGSLEGATIYVTLFPCNECAKAIIQSGIRNVVYDSDKYADADNFTVAGADGDGLGQVLDMVAGSGSVEAEAILRVDFGRFYDTLDASNKKLVSGRAAGYLFREIGPTLPKKMSHAAMEHRLSRLEKRVASFIG